MLRISTLKAGWFVQETLFEIWRNLLQKICNGSRTEITRIRIAKLLTQLCGSSGFLICWAQCRGVNRSLWTTPMKAWWLWMFFSGSATVAATGFSLELMNSWLAVKAWWIFYLPMKPWQSTGLAKAGACLALPPSAISQHIGMKSCIKHCSSAKNGHGIREHLQLPWWKTLLAFALACLEQYMQELFQLAPLGNIWCMPCVCGTKAEEKIVLGSQELGRILAVHFLMFLINLDAYPKFLWLTFLGQTNYSWSHGND